MHERNTPLLREAKSIVSRSTKSRNSAKIATLGGGGGRVVDQREYPLIPPGTYEARYHSHLTFPLYGGAGKLRMFFTISDVGPGFSASIPKFWNVQLTKSGFKVGTRSALLRDLCRLFPDYRPSRKDRIPLAWFKNRSSVIRIVSVTTDRLQGPIPPQLHYSKVQEILEVL